jgi:hypothetical protein
MKTLKDFVMESFTQGSDYFGEKIVGVSDKLHKEVLSDKTRANTVWLGPYRQPSSKTHEFYTKCVKLENPDGSPCNAGVGIYVKDGKMSLCSGHFTHRDIEITPEIMKELETAIVSIV